MRALKLKKICFETKCHYCHREFGDGLTKRTIDHKNPLCKGGEDTVENAVFACVRCNQWKGGKTYEAFLEILPKYLKQVKDNPNPKMRYGRPVLPILDKTP